MRTAAMITHNASTTRKKIILSRDICHRSSWNPDSLRTNHQLLGARREGAKILLPRLPHTLSPFRLLCGLTLGCVQETANDPRPQMIPKLDRKWSQNRKWSPLRTANDPRTTNEPHSRPQMIPLKKIGMAWSFSEGKNTGRWKYWPK